MDFFGTPWDAITLRDLQEFLSEEEDEGLTWETKGTNRPGPHDVRKAVSGLANQRGGFLIVGIRRDQGRWIADGVDFRGEEPAVWLSSVIQRGLDLVPIFDVRAFPTERDRHIAITRVEPVAVPPCVTSHGQVYERLPGKTEPVNAASLARLLDRGEVARSRAETVALEACRLYHELRPNPTHLLIKVALGPTGSAEDISGVLFTPAFERAMRDSYERLPRDPLFPYDSQGRYSVRMTWSEMLAAPLEDAANRERWRIRCAWDGSVSVSLEISPEDEDAPVLFAEAVMESAVQPAAAEATALSHALGNFGPAHAVLEFGTGGFQLRSTEEHGVVGFPSPRIQTWTASDGTIGDAQLERWGRELRRSAGFHVYEPDSQAD